MQTQTKTIEMDSKGFADKNNCEEQVIESVDVEPMEMRLIQLERENLPMLEFYGAVLAQCTDKPLTDQGLNWTVSTIYLSIQGKFVCQSVIQKFNTSERNRYITQVVDDEAGVIEFFGQGWMAKELYKKAGIRNVETLS